MNEIVTIVGKSAMMLALLALIGCGIAFAVVGFAHVVDVMFCNNKDEDHEDEKAGGKEEQ